MEQERKEREKEYTMLAEEIGQLKKDVASLSIALNVANESIGALEQKQSDTQDDLHKLRKAIITLHNVGVFDNIRSVDPLIKMKPPRRKQRGINPITPSRFVLHKFSHIHLGSLDSGYIFL